jgi:hypothetical protein
VSARPTLTAVQDGPPAAAETAPAGAYVFSTGAGLLLFYVKPDKTAEFEAVLARLAQVLDASADPERRQQGSGWRVFRATDRPAEVLYFLVLDPAVAGRDYDPIAILSEGAPAEAEALVGRLKDAVSRVERVGLQKIR